VVCIGYRTSFAYSRAGAAYDNCTGACTYGWFHGSMKLEEAAGGLDKM